MASTLEVQPSGGLAAGPSLGFVLRQAGYSIADILAKLMAEADRRKADLIVMGGYSHRRLRERLLGGVTYSLMHEAPVPLLMAH